MTTTKNRPDYVDIVRTWIAMHDLEQLCIVEDGADDFRKYQHQRRKLEKLLANEPQLLNLLRTTSASGRITGLVETSTGYP
jgi:hypothetical protein